MTSSLLIVHYIACSMHSPHPCPFSRTGCSRCPAFPSSPVGGTQVTLEINTCKRQRSSSLRICQAHMTTADLVDRLDLPLRRIREVVPAGAHNWLVRACGSKQIKRRTGRHQRSGTPVQRQGIHCKGMHGPLGVLLRVAAVAAVARGRAGQTEIHRHACGSGQSHAS